jgi:hypothetical protein
MIRHVEAVNRTYKINDIKIQIEIFNMPKQCPTLLNYKPTLTEKNKFLKKVS